VVNTPGEPVLFPVGRKILNALTRLLRPWDEEKESREKAQPAVKAKVGGTTLF